MCLVKIWRSTWNTYLVWRLNVVVRIDKQEVQDISGHTALRANNGADLYVNECQKIRHYRARFTEERRRRIRRRRMPNRDFFYFARCVCKLQINKNM